jgi:hypothetical protein
VEAPTNDDQSWADRSYLLAPAVPSVYRVRDASGTVIYIGKTEVSLETRFESHRRNAPWWGLAASVESIAVPTAAEVRAAEAREIHRYHPEHNTICVLCSNERLYKQFYPIYDGAWKHLRRTYGDTLHSAWYDRDTFIKDIIRLLGLRPGGKILRLIDPTGRAEPGNVCWSYYGPYKRSWEAENQK